MNPFLDAPTLQLVILTQKPPQTTVAAFHQAAWKLRHATTMHWPNVKARRAITRAVLGQGVVSAGMFWDYELEQCQIFETCQEDLDGDGVIGINDLMELLSSFGTMCEEPETGEFTCGDPMNYHGYDYATVQIGDQCWFAENLRNEHYAIQMRFAIPGGVESDAEWRNTTFGWQQWRFMEQVVQNVTDNRNTNSVCDPDWYNGCCNTVDCTTGMQ